MKQFTLTKIQYWQIVVGVMLMKGVKDIKPYAVDRWIEWEGEGPFDKFYQENVNPHRLGALAAHRHTNSTPEPAPAELLAYLERILLGEGRRRR